MAREIEDKGSELAGVWRHLYVMMLAEKERGGEIDGRQAERQHDALSEKVKKVRSVRTLNLILRPRSVSSSRGNTGKLQQRLRGCR